MDPGLSQGHCRAQEPPGPDSRSGSDLPSLPGGAAQPEPAGPRSYPQVPPGAGNKNVSTARRAASGPGDRRPALSRGGGRPLRPRRKRAPSPKGTREAGSLTVALGPDEQGHALQPLHVAGRHVPGAPVVPLPVLVERVNLHPPPGVGHRAAQGPGQRPRRSRPGRGAGEAAAEAERRRKRRAPRLHCRHRPPRGRAAAGMARSRAELWAPAFPRLRGLGAIVQPRSARPSRGGRAALRSLPPGRGANSGRRSLPCSRFHHVVREAASRAAAAAATASSGGRRHVFLPYTWPCHRSRRLRSALLLRVSHADRRLPLPQLLPLRGRRREPPGAERPRLLETSFLRRCHRLFRLPHRAKAAAILVRPSIAARGATQAAAAGAAR